MAEDAPRYARQLPFGGFVNHERVPAKYWIIMFDPGIYVVFSPGEYDALMARVSGPKHRATRKKGKMTK